MFFSAENYGRGLLEQIDDHAKRFGINNKMQMKEQFVYISGPDSIGKTELCEALQKELQARRVLVTLVEDSAPKVIKQMNLSEALRRKDVVAEKGIHKQFQINLLQAQYAQQLFHMPAPETQKQEPSLDPTTVAQNGIHVTIFDRSVIGNLGHCLMDIGEEFYQQMLRNDKVQHCAGIYRRKSSRMFILAPPEKVQVLKEMRKCMERACRDLEVPYTIVDKSNLAERVDVVLRQIQPPAP